MDGGNGSPGPRSPEPAVKTYVNLPAELRWICDRYVSDMRLPSLAYAIQHLLETHPALTAYASALYTEEDTDTSPL